MTDPVCPRCGCRARRVVMTAEGAGRDPCGRGVPALQRRDAGSIEQAAANARLIASAPELLEVLSVLVGVFDPDKQCIYEFARPMIERGRQVIKKVRGE